MADRYVCVTCGATTDRVFGACSFCGGSYVSREEIEAARTDQSSDSSASFKLPAVPPSDAVPLTRGIVRSAIEQWDREFGGSYPAWARNQVLEVPTRLAVYARVVHELIHPDNGYCNQCGGHWKYRPDESWDYLDGEHTPNCVFRREAEKGSTTSSGRAEDVTNRRTDD